MSLVISGQPIARAVVVGLARSGMALAEALLTRGVAVVGNDARSRDALEAATELERLGAELVLGRHTAAVLEKADLVALSPGVPASLSLIETARSRGLPVLSEIEIAWQILEIESEGDNRYVAVTGSNGKSTTSAWIAEMLRESGAPVALAGNIGIPLSSFLAERRRRDFVCELSSFQLETIDRFRPDVAVVTNITPDHMDRYVSFEAYAAAKRRVVENQAGRDVAVLNADSDWTSAIPAPARRLPFSRRGRAAGGIWVEHGALRTDWEGAEREVAGVEEIHLPGTHNLENALAASGAALALEVPGDAIRLALALFPGLPHRTETVGRIGGVAWVNDSKGTNVDATARSLEGYPDGKVIVILGGHDKGGDFAPLLPLLQSKARRVLLIGEASEKIARAIGDTVPVERCGDLPGAVACAAGLVRPEDIVLLSPACASFDQYRNFEERGRHFTELVAALEARDGNHGA
jgi:UDP-N-acetylmuramoylalanine--D-glutamate ligase